MQKMAIDFMTIPRLSAMAFAAPVRRVEKRKVVKIKFRAMGIKDRLNTGKAAAVACTSAASSLKIRITGPAKKDRPRKIKTDKTVFIRMPLRKYQPISFKSCLPQQ